MSHVERAEFLRAMAAQLTRRLEDFGQVWPRESGVVHAMGAPMLVGVPATFEFYAGLAGEFPFEERRVTAPSPVPGGDFGLLVREPVGVVGAIVAWNVSAMLITAKVAPALLAGCTVVVKASPEAPGEAYLMAEAAEAAGLPAGVFNVVVADRDVSELLVRDSRVDKIAFTGSTAAGRRIGGLCGERIARCTLELGGKSAAVILDDADIGMAAAMLAGAGTFLSGQACLALTRIVVTRSRHDQMVDALSAAYGAVTVGDPAGIGGEILLRAWLTLHGTGPMFVALDDPARLERLARGMGLVVPIQTVTDPASAGEIFRSALPVLAVPLAATPTPGKPGRPKIPRGSVSPRLNCSGRF